MRTNAIFASALLGLFLAGCSAGRDQVAFVAPPVGPRLPPARIVEPPAPLQCVPYARAVSGISIRGDAWTWWHTAKGRYRRGAMPMVGAVLVLKRTRRLRLGHIAVVRRIIGEREILVDQANWLNRGRIHLAIPVRDVSAGNDWSAVRVWFVPGGGYGAGTYPAQGFIYPSRPLAAVRLP